MNFKEHFGPMRTIQEIGHKLAATTVHFAEDEIVDPKEREGALEVNHEVVGRAVSGDMDAFAEMYDTYSGRVLGYCRRRATWYDYEDVAQDVWCKVFKSISSYQFEGPPISNWIFAIAHNTVASYKRAQNVQRKYIRESSNLGISGDDEWKDVVGRLPDRDRLVDPAAKFELDFDSALIEFLISQLPPEQRKVITFRYTKEMSIAQTAAETGKTETNVKALTHKGVVNLRGQYLRTQ